jgi:hypothetical protein
MTRKEIENIGYDDMMTGPYHSVYKLDAAEKEVSRLRRIEAAALACIPWMGSMSGDEAGKAVHELRVALGLLSKANQ